ncbi:MAG TPA: hypothetical protein DEB70_01230 [Planctomycetaceae bacterium]|nr:hypothetical protein [Planctomycetaceae bacterium]|tara:strand:+ start:395 stop:991 length:597 start_codon:yes stop_codon:yes gene_type:complete
MLDELFWILFRPLIFFQTQWLSFFAGILWGYFLRKSGGTSRIQLLGLASLLCLQMACNGILISHMHCGQIFNAGLQAAGGVSFFAIGAMMSRILLQDCSLKRLAVLSFLNGIILFGWQIVLTMEYLSEEDFLFFLIPCFLLFLITAIIQLGVLISKKVKQQPTKPKEQCLRFILVASVHLVFSTIATFFTTVAFDCGI